jgi:hypothetical protein
MTTREDEPSNDELAAAAKQRLATMIEAFDNPDPTDNRIAIPLCRDCHHEATFPGS